VLTWNNATETLAADEWLKQAALHHGSWWPIWEHWLAAHSSAAQVPARQLSAAAGGLLEDAPGRYVRG
jgi:polyhydroxyalkanoate synthase